MIASRLSNNIVWCSLAYIVPNKIEHVWNNENNKVNKYQNWNENEAISNKEGEKKLDITCT